MQPFLPPHSIDNATEDAQSLITEIGSTLGENIIRHDTTGQPNGFVFERMREADAYESTLLLFRVHAQILYLFESIDLRGQHSEIHHMPLQKVNMIFDQMRSRVEQCLVHHVESCRLIREYLRTDGILELLSWYHHILNIIQGQRAGNIRDFGRLRKLLPTAFNVQPISLPRPDTVIGVVRFSLGSLQSIENRMQSGLYPYSVLWIDDMMTLSHLICYIRACFDKFADKIQKLPGGAIPSEKEYLGMAEMMQAACTSENEGQFKENMETLFDVVRSYFERFVSSAVNALKYGNQGGKTNKDGEYDDGYPKGDLYDDDNDPGESWKKS